MKNTNIDVKFYTTYRDRIGKIHHTVQTFRNSDRTVITFQDHIFSST